MSNMVDLVVQMFHDIFILVPDSPFLWLFALAIVLIIANNIYYWLKGGMS